MPTINDTITEKYLPGCEKNVFLKDKASYKGHIYAVKINNTVLIKKIFSSVKSVFDFLVNMVFNYKNTFTNEIKINQIINALRTTNLITPKPPFSSSSSEEEDSDMELQTLGSMNGIKGKYYEFMDLSFPYLDGWLNNLKDLSKNQLDPSMLQYLKGELSEIKKMIARKEKKASQFNQINDEKTRNEISSSITEAFKIIKEEIDAFKKELEKLAGIQNLDDFDIGPLGSIPGIENAGNSCYMNSALQGLLPSSVVRDRIKNYNKDPIPTYESYAPTLQRFLSAYEDYNKLQNSQSSQTIGHYASQLRAELYHARLEKLGVDGIYDMADADLVVMLLGEALDLEFTLITRQTALGGNSTGGHFHHEKIVSDVNSRQLLWPEVQTTGKKGQLSLQEAFNQQCILDFELHDLDWHTQTKNGTRITVDDANRAYRLIGEPPPLLVFKVGMSTGEDMDSTFTPYRVGPRDEFLDATQAFDTPPEEGAKYRLLSVLRNHSRVHWTALARWDHDWYNCNDSLVSHIGHHVPKSTGAVMIYELINQKKSPLF